MIPDFVPGTLNWGDVNPALHPLDEAALADTVRSLGPARRVPTRPDIPFAGPAMSEWSHGEARSWADAMSYALVDRYGPWTLGWRWAHDEGDFDGGPVGHWCCPRDSVTTPDETLDRVEAALREWREWLEFLARCFDTYPLELADVDEQRILWERTARSLILHVVDRTGCGSGWYGHCRQVLTWFLDHRGVAPDVAGDLVDQAIGGRFHSWTGPRTPVVDDIAERLALSLEPADARVPALAAAPPDHLRRWLDLRASVAWDDVPDSGGPGPVVPLRDGAAEDFRDSTPPSTRRGPRGCSAPWTCSAPTRSAGHGSTSPCSAVGSGTFSTPPGHRRSGTLPPSRREAGNATASNRTPGPASTRASPGARPTTDGRSA
ncbi:hypothetical protein [Streptomyces californicus]|uniref:hypothetical protein n=1 Tax=Streptomyces californicus TaxID=67351 RepID=UPI00296FF6A0|nr:hypothetical protein [Streptomyces californicus]MDW4914510.1 hypothetical protein [Streptomyces californicus]